MTAASTVISADSIDIEAPVHAPVADDTTTPTIVRTKTLDSVAFDQTDLNSTMSIEFLYDENAGLYEAIQTAIAGANTIAVVVSSATGAWTGASMSIESAEMTVEAAGIATCSVGLTGNVVFT